MWIQGFRLFVHLDPGLNIFIDRRNIVWDIPTFADLSLSPGRKSQWKRRKRLLAPEEDGRNISEISDSSWCGAGMADDDTWCMWLWIQISFFPHQSNCVKSLVFHHILLGL